MLVSPYHSVTCFIIKLSVEVLTLMFKLHRYERYSLNNGWKFEVVDVTDSDLKGFKVCLIISLSAYFWA